MINYKMIKSLYTYSLLIAVSFLIISCTSETEETIDVTNKTFPNGKHLLIEKTIKNSKMIGFISGHNYGNTRSFTYQFTVKQDKVDWYGGSGEPKKIIFHKDTTYVYYLKEKRQSVTTIDSANNNTPITSHYEVLTPVFEKHIDKRYFFKLFGDDYWSEISLENYSDVKALSTEYDIPNDNEFILDYNPFEVQQQDSIPAPVIINE